MRTNSFKCPHCGESTRHYEITLQEVIAIDPAEVNTIMDKVANLFAAGADWTGLGKLYETIIGEVPYKCEKCQRCAWKDLKVRDVRYIGYAE